MLLSLRSTTLRALPHHARRTMSTIPIMESNTKTALDIFQSSNVFPTPKTDSSTSPTATTKFEDAPPIRDPLLEFWTTSIMQHGRRARAAKITSEMLLHINALTKAPALPILREAVELAAPAVRVMKHKRGGKAIIKPVALNERQRTRAAINWIMDASGSRPGFTSAERLARECIKIVQGERSAATEKKEEQHKLAMISRGNMPRV